MKKNYDQHEIKKEIEEGATYLLNQSSGYQMMENSLLLIVIFLISSLDGW